MKQVVNTTTFIKSLNDQTVEWEWVWETSGINHESTGGSNGETYKNLAGAINGYYSSQGHPDWKPSDPPPVNYGVAEKISANQYIIKQFAEQEN